MRWHKVPMVPVEDWRWGRMERDTTTESLTWWSKRSCRASTMTGLTVNHNWNRCFALWHSVKQTCDSADKGRGPQHLDIRVKLGKKKTHEEDRMAVTAGTRTKHTGLSLLGCKSVFRASRCLQVIHPESALLLRCRHIRASTCSPSYSWSLHTRVLAWKQPVYVFG